MKNLTLLYCCMIVGCSMPTIKRESSIEDFQAVTEAKKYMKEMNQLPKYTCVVEPSSQTVENEYFSATVSPAMRESGSYSFEDSSGKYLLSETYKAFNLYIKNKTHIDIELDWNKTLYIENGQTNGGFMFEGVIYKDRNNQKPPTIIFANSEFKKIIWPNNLVFFEPELGWGHKPIELGQNGVYLTIKVGEKEIKEKLLLNMSKALTNK